MTGKKGYGQFCPVSRAAEILGERWTPLVVRELLCGSVRFNDIQRGVPRMSSALLSRRLKELEHAGIVVRQPAGRGRGAEYRLTSAGLELFPILESMGNWAQRWMRTDLTTQENLDPDLLMWEIRRYARQAERPGQGRFVACFRFQGVPANRRRYWLLFEPDETDLCIRDPGFEVNLYVSAHILTMVRIWLGHDTVSDALRADRLTLDGSAGDMKAFRSWFHLSVFAPAGGEPPGSSPSAVAA